MPSQRKRIGFLPRADVQDIINQICEHNKLSQSKVTGILVEEALTYRGVLSREVANKSEKYRNNNKLLMTSNSINNESHSKNITLDENHINDEVQMINDFIEFKFFKKIMNQKNR